LTAPTLWATEDQTVHQARAVVDEIAGSPPEPRSTAHLALAHAIGLPKPWYQADGVWVAALGHGLTDAGLDVELKTRRVYEFVGQASKAGKWCWENCID